MTLDVFFTRLEVVRADKLEFEEDIKKRDDGFAEKNVTVITVAYLNFSDIVHKDIKKLTS